MLKESIVCVLSSYTSMVGMETTTLYDSLFIPVVAHWSSCVSIIAMLRMTCYSSMVGEDGDPELIEVPQI